MLNVRSLVAIGVVLAVVSGTGVVYSLISYLPAQGGIQTPSQSTIASSSLTATTGPNVASVTAPCGSPGVYCGGFRILSGSLTVNGNSSVLQVTLQETGNMWIGGATVYVNGTRVGPLSTPQAWPGNIQLNIQPGQTAVLVLTIPASTMPIQPGRTYTVSVNDWEGPPGERASAGGWGSINITAQ